MNPADVPNEWLDAFEAGIDDFDGPDRDGYRRGLATILILHEQQVRERIAGELFELPIVQHLGIVRSNATQPVADVAEAALRWVTTVILRPDLVPTSGRGGADGG